MGFGDLLGQMIQQGVGGPSRPGNRLDQTLQGLGGGGGGGGGALDGIFAQLQGALGGAGGAGGQLGGIANRAKDFLGNEQVGGLTGGQLGGIGAIAGALLGGGAGGAAKGGAMAILGTLAISALKAAQAGANAPAPVEAAPEEVKALASPNTERLLVTAMISAAKADGQVDQAEMEKIIGRLSADSVTDEEKQFVMNELHSPVDIPALAAQVTSPAQAAAVYVASLLAITPDSEEEKTYLAALAQALGLDDATASLLRQTAGVQV